MDQPGTTRQSRWRGCGLGAGARPSAPREGADRQEVCVMSQLSAATLWFSGISQVREHLYPSTAPLPAVFMHHSHLVHS